MTGDYVGGGKRGRSHASKFGIEMMRFTYGWHGLLISLPAFLHLSLIFSIQNTAQQIEMMMASGYVGGGKRGSSHASKPMMEWKRFTCAYDELFTFIYQLVCTKSSSRFGWLYRRLEKRKKSCF